MTWFVPTTIEEMRFMIAAPWGRGGECFDQADNRYRRHLAVHQGVDEGRVAAPCGPPSSRRNDLHPGKPPEGKLGGDNGDEGGQGFGEALEILGKTPVPLEEHAQLSAQVLAHG